MYRRPKFLEVLLEIRQTMSREADYDIDLFAEMIRSGKFKDEFNGANGQPKIEFPATGDRQQIADY
jgi:hypothetical protein